MKAWVMENQKQGRSKKREEKQPQQPLPLSQPPKSQPNHKPKPTSASPPSTQKGKLIRPTNPHRSTYQTTINPIRPLKHTSNHRKFVWNPTQLPQANPREEKVTRQSEKVDFSGEGEGERLGMEAWVKENQKQRKSKKREKRGEKQHTNQINNIICV